jgi:glucose-1-phosphate cytidylyltransferase
MKVVILAGGLGSRIMEESTIRPKPMVEIGGRPLLWHLMKIYSTQGFTDFIICLGYKGYFIKEYFANYALHTSDVTFDFARGAMKVHQSSTEPWSVTLVDTGEATMTGGRIKRIAHHLPDETFLCTYGDGLGDVDIQATIDKHHATKALATMTVVQPPGRFGAVSMRGDTVEEFREKPTGDGGWINGGFFVLDRGVLNYIEGDDMPFERKPLEQAAAEGRLGAYRHSGFWHPMDTQRDRTYLEEVWASGRAPWKLWP